MFPDLCFPCTETAPATSLILPLYPQMTVEEQGRVIDTLGAVVIG